MRYFLSIIIVFSLLAGVSGVFAEELILEFDPDEEMTEFEVLSEVVEEENLALDNSGDFEEIKRRQYIEGYRQLFEFNQNEIAGLEAVLFPIKEDIYDLERQFQLLSLQMQRIFEQEKIVRNKLRGLEDFENKLMVQIQLLALEMKGLIKRFERILVMYFRIKRQYVMENGSINIFQLFSSVSSPADLLFQDMLLERVQLQFVEQMNQVYGRQLELDLLRNQLNAVKTQTVIYQERIVEAANVLLQQADFKKQLLLEKEEEQDFFANVLEDSLEEQRIIVRRIKELAQGVVAQDFEFFPIESFIWPVQPSLGISSYFQDKDYLASFGIEHNAIDIPTDQLTPVKAALAGQVIEVHDGGNGYSYLQLAHRDGYSTVYGHLYAFKVEQGEMVKQGEIIALSGGAIGSNGAGRLTTGPHLHFEVLQDGNYIDPESVLSR